MSERVRSETVGESRTRSAGRLTASGFDRKRGVDTEGKPV